MSKSPRIVELPRVTASRLPMITINIPIKVPATPIMAQPPGRSCPATLERKSVQTGVVASSRLAFPAKVESTPKMKQSWYTTLPKKPRVMIRRKSSGSGFDTPSSRRTRIHRAMAAIGKRSALSAKGSSSSKRTLRTEKLTPQIKTIKRSPRSVVISLLGISI